MWNRFSRFTSSRTRAPLSLFSPICSQSLPVIHSSSSRTPSIYSSVCTAPSTSTPQCQRLFSTSSFNDDEEDRLDSNEEMIPAVSSASSSTSTSSVEPDDTERVNMKPSELVKELDRFIIGQTDAKRAVSVALRNRWRRHRLGPDLRQEVMPKNILLIGPTGCGKTEIARRLAKLTDSPFIKVEATKFTEVGFHGRDVDQIIRDLVRVAINQKKQQLRIKLKSQIESSVENRLITALIGKEADTPKDRQTWETHLRSGQIEQQKIEIEVTVKEPENTMAVPGLITIQKALGGGGRRTEKKTLTIAAARPILFEMESDKLVNTPDVTKQAMRAVEQDGIVFLDEIDKICSPSDRHYSGADASAEGVQRDLLPLIEGTTINTKYGNINTDHILFIASGAFHSVKPSDLMAELQGRLPIRVELKALTEDDLYSILTQTENNLIRQQIALLKTDNVELSFTESAIREIAKVAADLNRSVENIGARRLNTIIERIMDEISFTAADQPPGTQVVVDEKTVQEKVSDLLLKTDLAKFIL